MTAQSPITWAIRTRHGNIALERRHITEAGDIAATGGASRDPSGEVLLLRTKSLRTLEMGGPVWQRKADCQRFCYPDEQPVRVRLVEVST